MQERDAGPVVQDQSSKRAWKVIVTHIKHGEFVEDCTEFLIEGVLRKLDLAHVEVAYPADFEVFMDDLQQRSTTAFFLPNHITYSRCLPLRFGQDNVQEVRRRRDGVDLLQTTSSHDGASANSKRQLCEHRRCQRRADGRRSEPCRGRGGRRARYGVRFGKPGAKIWIR